MLALREKPNFITGKRWLCISRFLASGHFLLTANFTSLCKMIPATQCAKKTAEKNYIYLFLKT
jgi:hypothetical protein